ncbi:hypothetical protein EK904_008630, partial [Melospiza melodia maxima]
MTAPPPPQATAEALEAHTCTEMGAKVISIGTKQSLAVMQLPLGLNISEGTERSEEDEGSLVHEGLLGLFAEMKSKLTPHSVLPIITNAPVDRKTLNVVIQDGKSNTRCGVNFPGLGPRVSTEEKECQGNVGKGFRVKEKGGTHGPAGEWWDLPTCGRRDVLVVSTPVAWEGPKSTKNSAIEHLRGRAGLR